MMVDTTAQFIELVKGFVSGETDAEAFAEHALDFWQREYDHLQADTRENLIIAELCLDTDALSNEAPYDVTSEELLELAQLALQELLELQKEHNP
jgi:hypothetical protein